jgi:hypothetical protein
MALRYVLRKRKSRIRPRGSFTASTAAAKVILFLIMGLDLPVASVTPEEQQW